MTRDAFFVNRRVVPICDLILMRVRSRGDQRSHKPFQPGSTPGPATIARSDERFMTASAGGKHVAPDAGDSRTGGARPSRAANLLNRSDAGSLNGSGVTACADEPPLHSAPPVSAAQGVAINCVQPVITHRHARGAVTAAGGTSRGLDSTAFPAAAHDSRSRIWPALFFVLIGRCSPHLRRRANRRRHALARWLSVSPQLRRMP